MARVCACVWGGGVTAPAEPHYPLPSRGTTERRKRRRTKRGEREQGEGTATEDKAVGTATEDTVAGAASAASNNEDGQKFGISPAAALYAEQVVQQRSDKVEVQEAVCAGERHHEGNDGEAIGCWAAQYHHSGLGPPRRQQEPEVGRLAPPDLCTFVAMSDTMRRKGGGGKTVGPGHGPTTGEQ